jgi:hypothetical protein
MVEQREGPFELGPRFGDEVPDRQQIRKQPDQQAAPVPRSPGGGLTLELELDAPQVANRVSMPEDEDSIQAQGPHPMGSIAHGPLGAPLPERESLVELLAAGQLLQPAARG